MLRVLQRYRARRRLERDVGVWYHPEYASEVLAETARVANLEPRRGELILGKLIEARLIQAVDVRPAPVASLMQLKRFHSLKYLEQSISPEWLGRVFGLEPHFIQDTDGLLRSVRRQVGATIEAAHAGVEHAGFVGVNLGGGFHHAEPEEGSGFCVYNDVGVAIAELRSTGFDQPIAIVDLDYHQGNGNTVAYANDPTVMVYSIHGSVWSQLDKRDHEIHLSGSVTDRRYLSALRTTLEPALSRHAPKLVFYIAGNDVLAKDRLGSFWLSLRGVMERDAFVLKAIERIGASAVVTMGGGYSRSAWLASFHMVRHVLTGALDVEPIERADVRSQFTEIARRIDTADLVVEDAGFELTEADVLGDLGAGPRQHKLLNFYSRQGLELVLERYGLMDKVRGRGFRRLRLEVEADDPRRQIVRLFGQRPPSTKDHLLLELVVRRKWVPSPTPAAERMEVLFIDWLLLQDPTRGFTLDRPPLPGQEHPGLGLSELIQELMVQACRRLKLHGVFDRPAHFHNGLGGSKDAKFLDPEDEGRLAALLTVLAGIAPAEASDLVDRGALRLENGTVVRWNPGLHAVPVSDDLREYFGSAEYRRRVQAVMTEYLQGGLHIHPAEEVS